MKVTYSVILLLVALAATHAAPATKSDEKEPNKDVDFVPLEGRRPSGAPFPPRGVVDIDADGDGLFGNPFGGNPFPSLLNSIEALMARMRQQLNQILGRLPDKPGDAPFPELHLPNLGDIDLGKGNTTSVTKVIDGHKVTINETEYKQDGEDGGAFFKVRIIDVHPDSEEASTEKDSEAAPPKRDRESVEDNFNNEIPKTVRDNEELNFDNIETFDEVDVVPPHKYAILHKNSNWGNLQSAESIEDNSIDAPPQPIRDLSNDIYVNQLMADAGVPTNPDAEVFDVVDGHISSQYYPEVKPEKIVALNYVPFVKVPTHFPGSYFDTVGVEPASMPLYSGIPVYAPPTFSINNQPFTLPAEHMMPRPGGNQFLEQPHTFPRYTQVTPEEQIFIQPSIPIMPKQQNSAPIEHNENQQTGTTNKIVSQVAVENQKQNPVTQINASLNRDVKQPVLSSDNQKTKISTSNVEDSQKHLPSTNTQVPSTST